jgi:hypothetical protein
MVVERIMVGKPQAGQPLSFMAIPDIRHRRLCDKSCPAFSLCPLMPLAIQHREARYRACLVNEGPEEIKRAYRNLFVKGHSGIIEEIQLAIMEYGKVLREEGKALTPKERMRYLKDLTAMLLNLEKLVGGKETPEDPGQEEVEIDTGQVPDSESLRESPIAREMLKGTELPEVTVPKPREKEPVPSFIDEIFGKE